MRKSYLKSWHLFFALATVMFFSVTTTAQTANEDISTYSLIELAKSNNSDEFCYLLTEDSENHYYAVNTKTIDSRYVKIRMLEQSYNSDYLVNIGVSSAELDLLVFLVKKSTNKNSDEVQQTFEDYIINAKKELNDKNPEQLRLWMMQHDKYQK